MTYLRKRSMHFYKHIFDLLEVKGEDKLLEIGYGSGLGISELNKKLPGTLQ